MKFLIHESPWLAHFIGLVLILVLKTVGGGEELKKYPVFTCCQHHALLFSEIYFFHIKQSEASLR